MAFGTTKYGINVGVGNDPLYGVLYGESIDPLCGWNGVAVEWAMSGVRSRFWSASDAEPPHPPNMMRVNNKINDLYPLRILRIDLVVASNASISTIVQQNRRAMRKPDKIADTLQ